VGAYSSCGCLYENHNVRLELEWGKSRWDRDKRGRDSKFSQRAKSNCPCSWPGVMFINAGLEMRDTSGGTRRRLVLKFKMGRDNLQRKQGGTEEELRPGNRTNGTDVFTVQFIGQERLGSCQESQERRDYQVQLSATGRGGGGGGGEMVGTGSANGPG